MSLVVVDVASVLAIVVGYFALGFRARRRRDLRRGAPKPHLTARLRPRCLLTGQLSKVCACARHGGAT